MIPLYAKRFVALSNRRVTLSTEARGLHRPCRNSTTGGEDKTEDGERNYLFIINDSPYGNERPFNALRLALNLVKEPDACVQLFLLGDGVNCAVAGQKTPNGYYNVERMLQSIERRGEVAT